MPLKYDGVPKEMHSSNINKLCLWQYCWFIHILLFG